MGAHLRGRRAGIPRARDRCAGGAEDVLCQPHPARLRQRHHQRQDAALRHLHAPSPAARRALQSGQRGRDVWRDHVARRRPARRIRHRDDAGRRIAEKLFPRENSDHPDDHRLALSLSRGFLHVDLGETAQRCGQLLCRGRPGLFQLRSATGVWKHARRGGRGQETIRWDHEARRPIRHAERGEHPERRALVRPLSRLGCARRGRKLRRDGDGVGNLQLHLAAHFVQERRCRDGLSVDHRKGLGIGGGRLRLPHATRAQRLRQPHTRRRGYDPDGDAATDPLGRGRTLGRHRGAARAVRAGARKLPAAAGRAGLRGRALAA